MENDDEILDKYGNPADIVNLMNDPNLRVILDLMDKGNKKDAKEELDKLADYYDLNPDDIALLTKDGRTWKEWWDGE